MTNCSDFRPQEKLVFESEMIRSAIDRLQRYEPRRRSIFDPASKRWRFHDITQSPAIDLRLGDGHIDHPVLSASLRASTDHCCSAVHVFGPPTTQIWEFQWWKDGRALTGDNVGQLWPIGEHKVVQNYSDAGGMKQAVTWSQWRIADPTLRRGSNILPDWIQAQIEQFLWLPCKTPTLLVTFDGGVKWVACQNVWFDQLRGMATFNGTVPYITVDEPPPASTQTAFVPDGVRLIWAPYVETISVRVPADGHEGNWHDQTGKEYELCVYDEALAVGREFGNPVTTDTRRAQFAQYARSILDWRKDIAWSGSVVLEGIDTRFAKLNRRINFTANDGDGGDLVTGWEEIGAFVTDCDFDTEEHLTTITFSSDRLEQLGEDPSLLKEKLKIRALEQRARFETTAHFQTSLSYLGGEKYHVLQGITNNIVFEYFDELTGEQSR